MPRLTDVSPSRISSPRVEGLLGGGGLTGVIRIPYLLRDEFITDRAAGSVNGTPAEPGPGTRVVVDTAGTRLEVASGLLNVISGAAANGDPSIWWDAQTRVAGRLLIGSITPSLTTTIRWPVGWGKNPTGAPSANAFRVGTAAQLRPVDNGSTGPAIGIYATATEYSLCVLLRATGAYYLVKGGAFTSWTLLWVSVINSTAVIYPGSSNYNGAYTADYLRVPDVLWLPTPLAYDTFTRANGPLGNSEASGPDGQSTTPRVWTDSVGTWAVAGNVATCSALSGGVGVATLDGETLDVLHQANLTRAGGVVGGVVRYADADNYVYFGHDGANALLTKRVGGVETPVISAVAAYAAGAPCVCVVEGTSFSLYYNNVQIGVTSTIADAGLQTGTRVGLYTSNVGNSMDALQTFPRGTGGEYSRLDVF